MDKEAAGTKGQGMAPISHIALGLIGMIVGGAIALHVPDLTVLGVFIALGSGAMFGVGVIAEGVELGLSRRRD